MDSAFLSCVIIYYSTYNFYATSEVDETSLQKACTKSVGFFAAWALETKVPKNFTLYLPAYMASRSCGLAFWYFAKCLSRYGAFSGRCERGLPGSPYVQYHFGGESGRHSATRRPSLSVGFDGPTHLYSFKG